MAKNTLEDLDPEDFSSIAKFLKNATKETEQMSEHFNQMYAVSKDLGKLETFFKKFGEDLKEAKQESTKIRAEFKMMRDFAKEVSNGFKDISSVEQLYGMIQKTAAELSSMPQFMATFQTRSMQARSAVEEINSAAATGVEIDKKRMKVLNKAQEEFKNTQLSIASDSALNNSKIAGLEKEINNQQENSLKIKQLMVQVDSKYLLQSREKWANGSQTLVQLEAQVAEDIKSVSVQDARIKILRERELIEKRIADQQTRLAKLTDPTGKAAEDARTKLEALNKSLSVLETTYRATGGNALEGFKDFKTQLAGVERERNESFQKQVAGNIVLAEQKEKQAVKDIITQKKLGGYLQHINRTEDARLGVLGQHVVAVQDFLKFGQKIPNAFMVLDFILKSGYERFIALDKAAEEFRKQTGFSTTQMKELRKEAEAVNVQFADMGVSIENVYKSAKALTDVFGRTSLVSKEALKNVSLLSVNLGVAEESSANVLSTFQGLGGATEQAAMNVIKVGAGISEKAGVPFKLVMQDVANASETTLNMIGANPSKLMKSAIAARAMGLELNKMVESQRKMLDFSNSINDELTASAMLGKNINFQLARQYAFEGRVEDSQRAILDTVKRAGDFNKMNVYQREALAKASGMELKDLSKMLAVDAQREEIMNGTDEAKKAVLRAQEKELQQLKEINKLDSEDLVAQNQKALMQQRMQGIMTKLKNIFDSISVAIGDILEPIITPLAAIIIPAFRLVGMLAKVLGFILKGLLLPITLIGQGFGYIADAIDGAISSFTGFSDDIKKYITYVLGVVGGVGTLYYLFFGGGGVSGLLKNIGSVFVKAKEGMGSLLKSGAGAIKDKASSIFGKGSGDAAKTATKSAAASERIKPAAGEGVKNFLKDLAEGLKAMKGGDVLLGALNLIPASIGLIAMIPGFVGAILLSRLDGGAIKTALTGLAEGLKSMASTTVLGGSVALAVAAAGLAVMLIGIPAMAAIAFLGVPFSAGLIAMSTGLSALGGNPLVLAGIAVIGVLSLAFVGFGLAAKLMAEAFTQIAKSLPGVITPLAAIAIMSPLFWVAATGIGILGASIAGLALLVIPAIIAAGAIALLGASTSILSKGIEPLERLAKLDVINAAVGIGSLGIAMAKFGAGAASAGLGSFVGEFLGGDPIKKLEQFSNMGDKLKGTAEAIDIIASATSKFGMVDAFADAVNRLVYSLERLNNQLEKSGEIKVESLNALTAAGSNVESTTTATSTSSSSSVIESKLDELIALLRDGAIGVTLDGEKVSRAMAGRGRE